MAENTLTDTDYWYLTGYLDFAYGNDALSDGAWMQMMVDGIEYLQDPENADPSSPTFKGWDAHDVVMAFLERNEQERQEKLKNALKTDS